ncbi:FxsB family cyclophane-forming radical SAM/SPASM peptide maturase [Streptomyces sp. NPDC041068]|uniref:FxsB family cyclophane-forming radical SAM/SPASM peptide maturase n=1 Tax=Streptomyces sp. NPDC041068 TaxID=3155130 RepID=UPI0033C1AD3D
MHGGCNLSCDHCYVYEHADQSWRDKPRTMSRDVVAQAAFRIAEHVGIHRPPVVRISLHGGEPLLLGVKRLREIAMTLRDVVGGRVRLSLHVQSNGVMLNEKFCSLFDEFGVQVGISLDGDRVANDLHRRYANGRSSHARVLRALELLRRPHFRHLYGGVLCTVDLANDPISVYEALLAESPPRVDFLLPHATWEHPPPRYGESPAPYATWLCRIHDRWLADGMPVPIRLFDALTAASLGEPSGSEAVGLGPVGLAVVDTDGSWEQADSLKTAYAGAPATGMTVFTDSVDSLVTHPGIAARNERHAHLCATCRDCPVVRTCGGGLYAHRYRRGTGFDNPSVYCADLLALSARIPAAQLACTTGSRAAGRAHVTDHLPEGAFDAFAAGPGTADGIRALQDMQVTLTKTLIAGAVARPGSRSALGVAASDGLDLLIDLEGRCPDETLEVLRYPFVQAWADRCRCFISGVEAERDRAHIAGVAAAIAWRGGVTASLPLPVRAGLAHLPGVGALRVRGDGPTAGVSLGKAVLTGGEPVMTRRLTAFPLPVAVEDLDPYRADGGRLARGRLSDAEWEVWRTALVGAGSELSRLVPAYAATLRAGLRAVVPLRDTAPEPGACHQHQVARRAFGGVGLRLPSGPARGAAADPAATLLCEFQHAKLSAVLDAYAFFAAAENAPTTAPEAASKTTAETALVSLPWWPEPLPARQALHALYGHVALAELWQARSVRNTRPIGRGEHRDAAAKAHQRYLNRADITVDTLAAEVPMEPAGRRFVAGLRATVDRLASTARSGASRTYEGAGTGKTRTSGRPPREGA